MRALHVSTFLREIRGERGLAGFHELFPIKRRKRQVSELSIECFRRILDRSAAAFHFVGIRL